MRKWILLDENNRILQIRDFDDNFEFKICKPLKTLEITNITLSSNQKFEVNKYYYNDSINDNIFIDKIKEDFKIKRDKIFKETEWVRQRHNDRVELGIDDSIEWKTWLDYWESLRNIPNYENVKISDYINPIHDSILSIKEKSTIEKSEILITMSSEINKSIKSEFTK